MRENPNLSKGRHVHGRRFLGLLAIATLLLLAGCGTMDTEVTFYKGERWQTIMEVYLLPATVSMMGGEASLEAEMERSMPEVEDEEVEFSWEKERHEDGGVTYRFTIKGEGWDQLNEGVFDGRATITRDESGQVHLSYYTMGDIGFTRTVMRLRGGKIISSNADRVEGDTAVWIDPSRVEVVLTEKSSFGLGNTLLIAVGGSFCLVLVIVLGGLALFLWQRKRVSPAPAK
jgi:predicted enzyme related to lactoylglutathione lyase